MPKNCTDAPVYTTYTQSRPGHHAKNGPGRVITRKTVKGRVITQIADEEREGLQGADWDEADAEAAPKTTFGLKDFGKR